jgi:hypothetical protein
MRYFLGYTTTYNNPDVLPAKKNGDTPKFVAILLGKLIFQMIKKRLRGVPILRQPSHVNMRTRCCETSFEAMAREMHQESTNDRCFMMFLQA